MKIKEQFTYAAIFALSFLILWQYDLRHSFETDDAYITYRYAKNIAEGNGFVFNAGEHVIGTTTPLYTLVLAAGAVLGLDIPTLSHFINLAIGALVIVLIFSAVLHLTESLIASFVAVLFAYGSSTLLIYSVSGMETPFYIALILLSLNYYSRGALEKAALISGLAVITRLDGAALCAALFLHYVFKNKALPAPRVWLALLLPTLSWFIFAYLYSGSILPQSMIAKGEHGLSASRHWMLEHFVATSHMTAITTLSLIGITSAFLLSPINKRVTAQVLFIWGALYVLAFSLYKIDLYRWYLAPLAAALPVFVGIAMATLERLYALKSVIAKCSAVTFIAAVPLALSIKHALVDTSAEINWTNSVEGGRAALAEHMKLNSLPGDVLCTGAIGVVGWFTNLYIWDSLALVSKGAIGSCPERYRWYISEVPSADSVRPEIPNFNLVSWANTTGPTFLLYERASDAPAQAQTSIETNFENNIRVKDLGLKGMRLSLAISARGQNRKDYKFFVHQFRNGALLKQFDFEPNPKISDMLSGAWYPVSHTLEGLLPGDQISVGLFDERDPNFRRLKIVDSEQDHLEIQVN